ncbi:MAG: addiction module protein [Longimicrobiaceae bacterium]
MRLKPGSEAHGVPTASGGESASAVDVQSCAIPGESSGEDDGHAAAWAAEIQRRVEELRSGKVQPIPGEKVFEELKTFLR